MQWQCKGNGKGNDNDSDNGNGNGSSSGNGNGNGNGNDNDNDNNNDYGNGNDNTRDPRWRHNFPDTIPPWYSPAQLKPVYGNDQITTYWDVEGYADKTEGRANKVDARFIDRGRKMVMLLEMSCPWG